MGRKRSRRHELAMPPVKQTKPRDPIEWAKNQREFVARTKEAAHAAAADLAMEAAAPAPSPPAAMQQQQRPSSSPVTTPRSGGGRGKAACVSQVGFFSFSFFPFFLFGKDGTPFPVLLSLKRWCLFPTTTRLMTQHSHARTGGAHRAASRGAQAQSAAGEGGAERRAQAARRRPQRRAIRSDG